MRDNTTGLRERTPVTVTCGPGRTKQEFKKDVDVNLIVRNFQRTGTIKFQNKYEPQYMDVDPIDYQDALNTVIQAQNMFDDLPAVFRKRFNYDPAQFLEFIQDPANEDEARRLRLIPPIKDQVSVAEPENVILESP